MINSIIPMINKLFLKSTISYNSVRDPKQNEIKQIFLPLKTISNKK